jgi:hypothetical protein
VLVLRFVSLGPESAVKPLIEARSTKEEKEEEKEEEKKKCNQRRNGCGNTNGSDSNGNGDSNGADISGGDSVGSRGYCVIDINSMEDPSTSTISGVRGTTSCTTSSSSTRVSRIISVEQKMQRTATQKLQAERLVLAHGLFDMGTSLSSAKVASKQKVEGDSISADRDSGAGDRKLSGKKSDNSAIEDLFNENENDNEFYDGSARSDIPVCSEGTSEGTAEKHSSTFVYSPGDLIDEESTSKWFTDVCDRGTGRSRGSRSHSPLNMLKPLLPSSSSGSLSDCIPISSSTYRDLPVSYPILSGVFESSLMALYNTQEEIKDWSEWLWTLSIGAPDRDDIESCVKSKLCSDDGAVGSGFNDGSSSSSSSSCSSSSSSSSSSSILTGRRRNAGLLSEDALWKQVQYSTVQYSTVLVHSMLHCTSQRNCVDFLYI